MITLLVILVVHLIIGIIMGVNAYKNGEDLDIVFYIIMGWSVFIIVLVVISAFDNDDYKIKFGFEFVVDKSDWSLIPGISFGKQKRIGIYICLDFLCWAVVFKTSKINL